MAFAGPDLEEEFRVLKEQAISEELGFDDKKKDILSKGEQNKRHSFIISSLLSESELSSAVQCEHVYRLSIFYHHDSMLPRTTIELLIIFLFSSEAWLGRLGWSWENDGFIENPKYSRSTNEIN